MIFSSSPKAPPTTGVVELWKKHLLQWTPMEIDTFSEKMMTIATGDLYSVYVILQGIGSLSCIRVYNKYRNPLWGAATLDAWNSSTRTFQQKNRFPEMINFFLYCIKQKWFFQAHRRAPPRPVS